MANEDKVVDFGAACYAGLPDCSPVDTRVSLHLDVVFEHGGASLKHLVPCTVSLFGKTKSVAADHRAVLQYDPVAKAAKLTHDGVRVREEIIANLRAAINCNETVQHGVAPNFDVFVHIAVRPNMRPVANLCGFRDDGCRMNPRRIGRRLIEKLDRLCKCQIGIAGAQRRKRRQRRLPLQGNSFFDEDRRGARRLQQRKVAPIGKERNLPRFGMLDSRYPANLEFRWTFQSASQFLRNFGKFHEGAPQFFLGLSASLAQAKEGSIVGQPRLFVEKAGLRSSRGSSGSRLAPGDANNTEDSHFRERGAGNKDTIGG